ncbi:MAG: WXG100 family type VII secretion target [Anaerolinea sp.]|nr:WXG100 family type VII secretion target [Anaerolinea sp.]
MFARRIQANYDHLQEILKQFMRHADRTVALTVQVEGLVDQLQGGAWRGVGAEAFYTEMSDLILPAMRKLEDALQFAGEGTYIPCFLLIRQKQGKRLLRCVLSAARLSWW